MVMPKKRPIMKMGETTTISLYVWLYTIRLETKTKLQRLFLHFNILKYKLSNSNFTKAWNSKICWFSCCKWATSDIFFQTVLGSFQVYSDCISTLQLHIVWPPSNRGCLGAVKVYYIPPLKVVYVWTVWCLQKLQSDGGGGRIYTYIYKYKGKSSCMGTTTQRWR